MANSFAAIPPLTRIGRCGKWLRHDVVHVVAGTATFKTAGGSIDERKNRTGARTPETRPADDKTRLAFDSDRLDKHLDEAGIDVLIASSKHNIQYLLGGYRFFFFEAQDAAGLSRYLPLFTYFKGQPERSAYVGNRMESWEEENGTIPVPEIQAASSGTEDAMRRASRIVARNGKTPKRIGVERAFLPADAESVLREAFPDAEIVDALIPLERLRAREIEAGARAPAQGLGRRHRFDAGGHRQPWARDDQARAR